MPDIGGLASRIAEFSASEEKTKKVQSELVPALMRFPPHDELEFPLDAVDPEGAAKWVDDRIVVPKQPRIARGEIDVFKPNSRDRGARR